MMAAPDVTPPCRIACSEPMLKPLSSMPLGEPLVGVWQPQPAIDRGRSNSGRRSRANDTSTSGLLSSPWQPPVSGGPTSGR